MKKKLLALLMGTSLVLAACGGDDAKETAGGGADAEKLFNQKCSSCHGTDLKGGVGPNLTAIGAKLGKADIEKVIANGQGGMPPGLLKGEDASTVASWLSEKK